MCDVFVAVMLQLSPLWSTRLHKSSYTGTNVTSDSSDSVPMEVIFANQTKSRPGRKEGMGRWRDDPVSLHFTKIKTLPSVGTITHIKPMREGIQCIKLNVVWLCWSKAAVQEQTDQMRFYSRYEHSCACTLLHVQWNGNYIWWAVNQQTA